MKRVTVNGVVITAHDGARMLDGYRGQWKCAGYGVLALNRDVGMNGILRSVRVNWPDRDYYTTKPRSWPTNSSIQGVLRGPESGGSHAQFQIESDAGTVFVEFFAETDVLNEEFFASFFNETAITPESYRFPDDGDGHIEMSPLYPSPEELP